MIILVVTKKNLQKGRENEMGYIVHFAMKSKKGHALDLQATYLLAVDNAIFHLVASTFLLHKQYNRVK